MGTTRALSMLHPATILIVFGTLIVLSAITEDPTLQGIDALLACLCLLALDASRKTLSFLLFVLLAIAAITLVNPLFDQSGADALFTYLGDRRYTLQGLLHGFQTALMLASVVVWFACLDRSLDRGMVLFVLGPLAPSVALVLTMGLRLVPAYARRASEISEARKALGLGRSTRLRDRARDAACTLSSLATQALISSVETASSMRSRGFGTARRTSVRAYRFRTLDACLIAIALSCAAASMLGIVFGWQGEGAGAFGGWAIACALALPLLAALPTLAIVREELAWHCSQSRA